MSKEEGGCVCVWWMVVSTEEQVAAADNVQRQKNER